MLRSMRWMMSALVLPVLACNPSPTSQADSPTPDVSASLTSVAPTQPAAAGPESVGMSSERLAELRSSLQKLVDDGRFAGFVTVVARRGQIVSFDAIGYADAEARTPMQEDSIFRIASMTKPVTGVAMMTLYEEGKWQLDDPVAKYIPEFANLQVPREDGELEAVATPMTMRQLMSHTAGLAYGLAPATPVDTLYRENNVMAPELDLQGMIDRLAKLPLAYQPGTRWQYSIAVDVQGHLVEKLSGQRLDDFLRERIFEPLGMKDTDFKVAPSEVARLARIHRHDESGKLVPTPNAGRRDPSERPSLLSGGGGLLSTADDYRRFSQMLLNGGELDGVRILQPATVELMYQDHLPEGVAMGGRMGSAFPDLRFGLDFAVMQDPPAESGYGKNTYFWGGAFGTWFWIDPEHDLLMVGMVQHIGASGSTASLSGAPDLRRLSSESVYGALIDRERDVAH